MDVRATWTFIIHSQHIFLVTKERVALDSGLEEIDFSLESVKCYGRGRKDNNGEKKSGQQRKQEKESRRIEENGK